MLLPLGSRSRSRDRWQRRTIPLLEMLERRELLNATVGVFGKRLYMSWRIRMTPADGRAIVAEQHAYASGDGPLTTVNLLCSGFAPA